MKTKTLKTRKEKIFIVCSNLLLFLAVVCVGVISFVPQSKQTQSVESKRLLAIYEGNRNSNKVSLMINVYWGTEYLNDILDVLKTNNVKTTFFVGGMWVAENPDMLQKIYQQGHEIANHGYSHKNHDKLSFEGNINEIQNCNKLVFSSLGINTTLFAPPSGAYNNDTIKAAESLGFKTIMWTRDTIDWRDKNTNLIISRATTSLKGGDLILMHPTKNTLEALPTIISKIFEKGLTVAPVSQTLA